MKRDPIQLGLIALQIVLSIIVITQLDHIHENLHTLGSKHSGSTAPLLQADLQAPQPPTQVSVDDDPMKGDKNAPVTIVEFSDFQCPYCARFHLDTFPQIDKDYIQTGKVRFVYRDFPLPFHTNAEKAAEAAECAHEQGKFWEYHNKIFENQKSLSMESLKQWAKDLGLDVVRFNSCLDSGKMAVEIQKDAQEGASYGVSGTPAFFVNGQLLSGAQPYTNFKQLIDQQLAR